MRETSVFGEQLSLHRRVVLSKTENVFFVTDTVKNLGSMPTPCGVLYNYNLGYPFLSEDTVVTLPKGGRLTVSPPDPDGMEFCEAFTLSATEGTCRAENPSLGIAATLTFDPKRLGYFTCYRQFKSGAYVLALEPANAPSLPRRKAREKGLIKELAPQEAVTYETKWTFQKEW